MKPANIKYEEAICRNIASFKSSFATFATLRDTGEWVKKIAGDSLESLKTRIGIRQRDTIHDAYLTGCLAEIKQKVEAGKKKDKADKAASTTPTTSEITKEKSAKSKNKKIK